jgi:hypothetical protein
MNRGTFLEFLRLAFDTNIVLENELEGGFRTFLDETDRQFYATISSLLRSNEKPYVPFK